MFDTHSDFALNKCNKGAIVCKSVTGVHTELTCADFSSEAEFLKWKNWSDGDYAGREAAAYEDDRCYSLDAERDTTGLSVEDELVSAQERIEQAHQEESRQAAIRSRVKSIQKLLTKTQYRRLWMLRVDGLSIKEIAAREAVSLQRIYRCLEDAERRLVMNSFLSVLFRHFSRWKNSPFFTLSEGRISLNPFTRTLKIEYRYCRHKTRQSCGIGRAAGMDSFTVGGESDKLS